jgi:GNAT superfamily N-acetyltransferase
MPVEMRALRLEDRAVWEELFDGYAAFYKTTTSAEGKAGVWDWIFGPQDFWADLAVLDGQIVGLCQYQLMHRSLSGAKVVYLSDLYVRPEVRGARGIGNVRWLTQEFNYAGRRLYDTYRPKSDFILYSVPVEG